MTEENKEKETLENQKEEETPEKTSEGEIPEGEKPEESTERQPTAEEFKAVDGARKHFEEEAKGLKAELQKLKAEKPPTSAPQKEKDEWRNKVEFLLQSQDKKYSEDEFNHIANIAAQKDIGLKEAAKQEDEYIQFKREKAEKENAPEPSTKQGGSETEKPLSEMTLDEKNDYAAKRGFVKSFPKAKPL